MLMRGAGVTRVPRGRGRVGAGARMVGAGSPPIRATPRARARPRSLLRRMEGVKAEIVDINRNQPRPRFLWNYLFCFARYPHAILAI